MSEIEIKLDDIRHNLKIMQLVGCPPSFYGEGLIEYARLLGEWEALLTSETFRGKE